MFKKEYNAIHIIEGYVIIRDIALLGHNIFGIETAVTIENNEPKIDVIIY